MPTRGMIMCAAGGINGLAAPTAMARLLRESFQLMWPLELYFTQGEASHPRFGSVVGNWTASLRSEGMAVSVHELHESAVGNRYECKLLALLETGLDEVLFCDSDLALLRSPEILFLSEEYRRNGALFFRDRQILWSPGSGRKRPSSFFRWLHGLNFTVPARYRHYRAVEREGHGQPSLQLLASNVWLERSNMHVESGIFVFDRRRQERTLEIMRDQLSQLQARVHGDKEVYWLAAELANSRYALSPYAPGQLHGGALSQCCGLTVHFSPTTGEPLVIHGIKDERGWGLLARDETLRFTKPSRNVSALWRTCPRMGHRCPCCHLLAMRWDCGHGAVMRQRDFEPFSPGERRLLQARGDFGRRAIRVERSESKRFV
jgi:hypothetical protein